MESVENCKQFPTLTTWKTPATKTTKLVLSCLERERKKLKGRGCYGSLRSNRGLAYAVGECFADARESRPPKFFRGDNFTSYS